MASTSAPTRSPTPTPEMRRAMADAEVGDDVYGEDPTVNRLQSLAAALLGKEAALYVPSGTMANQLAIRVLADGRHRGAVSRPRARLPLRGRGRAGEQRRADASAVGSPRRRRAPRSKVCDHHLPQPSLVVIENTYMALSGAPIDAAEMTTLCEIAHAGGLPVHVDGARIWNAAIALGTAPRELVAPVDTVMFCLSKGLGAPVGSLLCGPADVIAEARAHRSPLGRRDAPGGRDRGRGHRRARDDGRAPRRRPRARPRASPTRSPQRWPGSVDPATRAHEHRVRRPARGCRPTSSPGSTRPACARARSTRARSASSRTRTSTTTRSPRTIAALRRARGPARDRGRTTTIPQRVLAIYAHPDDPEISAGGTLARWADAGAEVHVVVTTRGDKGTNDPDADLDALVAAPRRGDRGRGAGARHRATITISTIPTARSSTTARCGSSSCGSSGRCGPTSCAAPTRPRCSSATRYVNHRDHRVTGWATLDAVAPAAGQPALLPRAARAKGSPRTRCARSTSRARSSRTSGSTSAPRSSARSRRCSVTPASSSRPATGSATSSARPRSTRAGPRASTYAEAFRRIAPGLTPASASRALPDAGGARGRAIPTARAAPGPRSSPRRSRRGSCPASAPPSSFNAHDGTWAWKPRICSSSCSARVGVSGQVVATRL